MALLVECPKCKKRLSISRKKCECGFKLGKFSGKVYWVSVYVNGRKKRERIGPNKEAAEQREREILKLRAEERFIDKDPAARMTLGELCQWYLKLPEVKAKDSYGRDKDFLGHLKRLLGEGTKAKYITVGKIESYQSTRLFEPSPRHLGENIRPATVNKEVSCLKTIFNKAIHHGKLKYNPIDKVKKLSENNVRERVLTLQEFRVLIDACDIHIRPVVTMAYYMGMRKSEIIRLTWPEVDLKKGFIRLSAKRTKTDRPRNIPIHPEIKTILEGLPRGLHTDRVFLYNGKPFDDMGNSFESACERARIEDFTFHDLRHCALNNLRKAGNDYFKIMALSGHKTMSCFKRYNLVTEEELSQMKWPSQDGNPGAVGTYIGTNE
jgi:integrase